MFHNHTTPEWQEIVGEQIHRLRLQRNIEQTLLAERAGVALNAVKNLESGKGSTVKTLVRVLVVLDRAEWLQDLGAGYAFSPLEIYYHSRKKLRDRARQKVKKEHT